MARAFRLSGSNGNQGFASTGRRLRSSRTSGKTVETLRAGKESTAPLWPGPLRPGPRPAGPQEPTLLEMSEVRHRLKVTGAIDGELVAVYDRVLAAELSRLRFAWQGVAVRVD